MTETVASPMHGGVEQQSAGQLLMHYATDSEHRVLEVDAQRRVAAHQRAWLASLRCWSPYSLLTCSSCYMLLRFPAHEREVARAHRLVLRDRTLLLEVDEHVAPAARSDGVYVPSCCWPGGLCAGLGGPCGADKVHVPDRQAVIRLEELEDISVVASPRGCCGCPDGPDHLVITVQQSAHEKEAFRLIGAAAHVDGYAARSGRLAAVIAGPKDGEAFCAAVRAQAEKVRRENLDTDPPSPETREILPRRSGAPPGVAAPKPLEMAWARERAPAEKVVPAETVEPAEEKGAGEPAPAA